MSVWLALTYALAVHDVQSQPGGLNSALINDFRRNTSLKSDMKKSTLAKLLVSSGVFLLVWMSAWSAKTRRAEMACRAEGGSAGAAP